MIVHLPDGVLSYHPHRVFGAELVLLGGVYNREAGRDYFIRVYLTLSDKYQNSSVLNTFIQSCNFCMQL